MVDLQITKMIEIYLFYLTLAILGLGLVLMTLPTLIHGPSDTKKSKKK